MIKTIILSEVYTDTLNKLIQDKESIGYEVIGTHIKQSLTKDVKSEIVVIMQREYTIGMD